MSSCHQCGYSLESDAETICPGCGIDLRPPNDQNNTNETGNTSSPESIGIQILLLLPVQQFSMINH